MSGETKKVSRLFFIWQDEKKEQWLREMANKGWILTKANAIRYLFEKSESKDYIYKFDFRNRITDLSEYKRIFQEAGWEYISKCGRWYCFRTEADNCITPDIYTDTSSKVEKYKSLLTILIPIFAANILSFISILMNPEISHIKNISFARGFSLSLIALLGYGIIKMLLKIKAIKSQ